MATKHIRTKPEPTAVKARKRNARKARREALPNLDGPPTLRSERVPDALHGMRVRDVSDFALVGARPPRPTLAELQDSLRDVDAELGFMLFASAAEIEAVRTARAGIRSAIAWLQEAEAKVTHRQEVRGNAEVRREA